MYVSGCAIQNCIVLIIYDYGTKELSRSSCSLCTLSFLLQAVMLMKFTTVMQNLLSSQKSSLIAQAWLFNFLRPIHIYWIFLFYILLHLVLCYFNQEEIQEDTTDVTTGYLSQDFGFDKKEYSTVDDGDAPKSNEVTSVIDATVSEHEIDAEAKGLKLLHNFEEMEPQSKKARIIIPDSDEEDLPGKMLSPTCSLSETEDQSNPQRDGDNVLPVSSLPVCNEKQNFRCTACDKVAIEVHAHPLLRVVLCLDCKTSMKTKMQVSCNHPCLVRIKIA